MYYSIFDFQGSVLLSSVSRQPVYISRKLWNCQAVFWRIFWISGASCSSSQKLSFILHILTYFCVRRLANSSKLPPGCITVKRFPMFCKIFLQPEAVRNVVTEEQQKRRCHSAPSYIVARGRLELSTPRVWTACSSQLSYLAIFNFAPDCAKRAARTESMGPTGLEPVTLCL